MPLLKFLGSQPGRVTRALAGLALIGTGLFAIRGTGGMVLAGVGLLPLAAGVFDFCLLAPLFGMPFLGPKFRQIAGVR